MKNIIISIFICVIRFLPAYSQETTVSDSLFFYRQQAEETAWALGSASQLLYSGINKTGFVGLQGNYKTGHFRLSQEAEYDGRAQFKTSGIHTLGRFKLVGNFGFTRTWQDSLAWTSKGLENDIQPYYYAAGKAGKYLRQKYHLSGLLAYEIVKDKWFASLGADYLYNQATRSVDPRPSVNTFNFIFIPEISYKTGNQVFGVFYKLGYGDEYVRNTYKNDAFASQGTSDMPYPERLNFLIESFAFDETKQAGLQSSLDRRESFRGLGAHYSVDAGKWKLRNTFSYMWWEERSMYITTSEDRNASRIGDFQLETIRFTSIASQHGKKSRQQLIADADIAYSDDLNYELGGRNYLYKHRDYSVNYLNHQHHYKHISPEYGLFVNYRESFKQDYIKDHYFKYAYIHTGFSTGLYLNGKNKEKLAVALALSFRKSLQSDVRVPIEQESLFTRGVIYTDHYYRSLDAVMFNLRLHYISNNIVKNIPFGISLNNTLELPTNHPGKIYPAAGYADKYRFSAQLQLNLYL